MQKKSLLALFLLTVFFYPQLEAAKIDVQQAIVVAANFYQLNSINKGNPQASLVYTKTEADNTVDYYIFNVTPKGFVIVSADDNMEPIIGYSTESDFDLQVANQKGLSYWMQQSASKIYQGIQQQVVADGRISSLWSAYKQGLNPGVAKATTVSPLLTTTWNQSPYYNALCPFNSTDNQRCVTGCVATAMAQIMRFWKSPTTGTGSYTYTDAPPSFTYNYGTQSANFGTTTYNWANMPTSISAANNDVATLMYHCGVAVAMDYGDANQGGSGAYVLQSEAGTGKPCAQKAYSTYFGYNATTMQGVKQSSYTTANWTTLLETELLAGRPIQYEGVDPSAGGHTWVCDGFDANNLFHMNWGWGGYDNGYFAITNLNASPYAFNSNDAALIGIQPSAAITTCGVITGATTASITSTSAIFNWTAVTSATSYKIQYRKTGTTTWTSATATTNTYTATGLTASTSYEWQVQTVCSSGSSAFSGSTTFSTLATSTCGVPSGLASSNITTTGATISWTAVTGAQKYNLQWKLSTATAWTTVSALATNSYTFTALTCNSAYQYQVQTVCSSGSSAYSTAGTFTTTACAVSYCTSKGTTTYEYINKVAIGSINNISGNNSGYGTFLTQTTTLTGGTTATITLTPAFVGSAYTEYWTVYIDYNHNGSFTDAGETVVQVSSTAAVSKTFTVPTTALNGTTRMRIQMHYGSYQTNPCASYTFGEVEDYSVNISGNAHLSIDAAETTEDAIPATDNIGQLKMYPNPAVDNLNIEFNCNSQQVVNVNLYTLSGQRLLGIEKVYQDGTNIENIGLNDLSTGIYIVEVATASQTKRERIIVTK